MRIRPEINLGKDVTKTMCCKQGFRCNWLQLNLGRHFCKVFDHEFTITNWNPKRIKRCRDSEVKECRTGK